jgi:uncharacterized protein (TIGR02217 family)
MSFFETRFPDDIARGASGGPGFQTDVITVNSGFEQRNAVWADARCSYDVSHGIKQQSQLDALVAFFRVMGGRAHGFRFKDYADYQVGADEGIFTAIDATHFQMWKRYTSAGSNHDREITKPVTGTVAVTGGTVASIDYTTGIVTMTTGTPTAWTGQFDVPCRFDTDQMKINIAQINLFSWGGIPVVEVRV